jgi:hypothetical protein
MFTKCQFLGRRWHSTGDKSSSILIIIFNIQNNQFFEIDETSVDSESDDSVQLDESALNQLEQEQE